MSPPRTGAAGNRGFGAAPSACNTRVREVGRRQKGEPSGPDFVARGLTSTVLGCCGGNSVLIIATPLPKAGNDAARRPGPSFVYFARCSCCVWFEVPLLVSAWHGKRPKKRASVKWMRLREQTRHPSVAPLALTRSDDGSWVRPPTECFYWAAAFTAPTRAQRGSQARGRLPGTNGEGWRALNYPY